MTFATHVLNEDFDFGRIWDNTNMRGLIAHIYNNEFQARNMGKMLIETSDESIQIYSPATKHLNDKQITSGGEATVAKDGIIVYTPWLAFLNMLRKARSSAINILNRKENSEQQPDGKTNRMNPKKIFGIEVAGAIRPTNVGLRTDEPKGYDAAAREEEK